MKSRPFSIALAACDKCQDTEHDTASHDDLVRQFHIEAMKDGSAPCDDCAVCNGTLPLVDPNETRRLLSNAWGALRCSGLPGHIALADEIRDHLDMLWYGWTTKQSSD